MLHALQPTSLTAAFVLHCLKTVQAAPQRDMLSGMGGVAWFQLWQGMLLCLCSDEPAMEFGRASMRKVSLVALVPDSVFNSLVYDLRGYVSTTLW